MSEWKHGFFGPHVTSGVFVTGSSQQTGVTMETMLDRATRALCYSYAERLGLKPERVWAAQGQSFRTDAKAALRAIMEPSDIILKATSAVDLDFAAEPAVNDARIWRAAIQSILSEEG